MYFNFGNKQIFGIIVQQTGNICVASKEMVSSSPKTKWSQTTPQGHKKMTSLSDRLPTACKTFLLLYALTSILFHLQLKENSILYEFDANQWHKKYNQMVTINPSRTQIMTFLSDRLPTACKSFLSRLPEIFWEISNPKKKYAEIYLYGSRPLLKVSNLRRKSFGEILGKLCTST